MMEHPLMNIIESRKKGIPKGAYSACSASEYVIEACMDRALKDHDFVVIESTANQVNQYGGYTGMTPVDFRDFVRRIAEKSGFPMDKVILGGDHLGPLTWKNEVSDKAMQKSKELIRQYVMAGYTKIHIDTSMKLADDDAGSPLNTEVIAERGAILCKEAEEAFTDLKRLCPGATAPVYVVGSEVPIPGGSQDDEGEIRVTEVEDFDKTVETFQNTFRKYGLEKAWNRVIAVVVQPGVEFGDDSIHEYDRKAASALCKALKKYPGIVFEGHSTDYQTAQALKQMVEDGIAILKVGPALTFALREALFSLSYMENELFKHNPSVKLSNFIDTLESAMIQNPDNWKKHYHGSDEKLRFARKYSFSDRARYYLPVADVQDAVKTLVHNLNSVDIPLTLIDQFMPIQYKKIRCGLLAKGPESLLKDRITDYIDDYIFATHS